jgi:hypothetical protein
MRRGFCLLIVSIPILSVWADETPKMAAVIERAFARWDRDQNEKLSLEEINRAVIDPKIKGEEAAAIASLRRAYRIESNKLADSTKTELFALANLNPVPSGKPPLQKNFEAGLTRLSKLNRELFPNGKPDINALNQGKLGDCFCLAPLGAICHRDASDVKNWIAANPDGTYRVTFGETVYTVSAPTDCELILSASAESNGIWVNVYEKAVGMFRLQELPEDQRPITALDLLTKGGSAGTMLSIVTGKPIERFPLTIFKSEKSSPEEKKAKLDELRKTLIDAFFQRRLVTTGTNKIIDPKPPDINGNHAYAIIGYDEKSDRIKIWNPHGQNFTPKGDPGLQNGYATQDGVFEMPLSEFVQVFAGLAFGTR